MRAETARTWAGLAAGPAAWATSTQANYSLVSWDCAHHSKTVFLIALVLAAFALAGSAMSAGAWRRATTKPALLIAGVGAMLAALLAVVILTQGAASLFLA